MAIENEFKYLIGTDVMGDLHKKLKTRKLEHGDVRELEITQFYINDTYSRVRKTVENGLASYTHTSKYQVYKDTLEIETPITERDYCSIIKTQKGFTITKNRLVTVYNDMTWEIDFFKSESFLGEFFLNVVEVEVPETVKKHPQLPKFLLPYCVHEISKWDESFHNRNIICASRAFKNANDTTLTYRKKNG